MKFKIGDKVSALGYGMGADGFIGDHVVYYSTVRYKVVEKNKLLCAMTNDCEPCVENCGVWYSEDDIDKVEDLANEFLIKLGEMFNNED